MGRNDIVESKENTFSVFEQIAMSLPPWTATAVALSGMLNILKVSKEDVGTKSDRPRPELNIMCDDGVYV